jgi:isopenicillin-N epimerase
MTPYGASLRKLWPLEPGVTYLNHGGYGVTPDEIMKVQAEWRLRIERNPTAFMTVEYPTAIRDAAALLARYVGAEAEDLVFVDNATTGCNAVLRSLDLQPGDEIMVTDLTYGAIVKAARYVASRTGARLVTVNIPMPVRHDEDVLTAFGAHFTARTRLLILDHIVSPAGLVMPVRRLASLAHGKNVRVLVDGAHAPGNVPLNVTRTGADWYVANCHKWLFAPRACGFLWANGAAREGLHPLAISHGYEQGLAAEFDWTGTRDPSAFLSVPAAIAFHDRLGGRDLMARNAELAYSMGTRLASTLKTNVAAAPSMCAAMVAVRLPKTFATSLEEAGALRQWLSESRNIEVALGYCADAPWLRIGVQAYNEEGDVDTLAAALAAYRR